MRLGGLVIMAEENICSIKARARELLKAIEDNYESCKKAGIDNTGSAD